MPHDVPAGSAGDWLQHAQADLRLAEISDTTILRELLCFHAQQACEKSLKALLLHNGTEYPRTHNLKTLLDLLRDNCEIPDAIDACATLTDYAVLTRYPGIYEPVEVDEYAHAVRIARTVAEWVRGMMDSEKSC